MRPMSTLVSGRMSSVVSTALLAFLAPLAQPARRRDEAEILSPGKRRIAEDGLTRRDVVHDAGLRADSRARADRQVTREPGLAARHDEIAEAGAARDPDLRDEDAAPSKN